MGKLGVDLEPVNPETLILCPSLETRQSVSLNLSRKAPYLASPKSTLVRVGWVTSASPLSEEWWSYETHTIFDERDSGHPSHRLLTEPVGSEIDDGRRRRKHSPRDLCLVQPSKKRLIISIYSR